MANEMNINPDLAALLSSMQTIAAITTAAKLPAGTYTKVDTSMYFTAPDTSVYTWRLTKM